MSAARDEILGRIRSALRDVPAEERAGDVPLTRGYRRRGTDSAEELIDRLTERLRDYGAGVERIGGDGVGTAVTAVCRERGLRQVVVPPGVPLEWRPDGVEVIEDRGLGARELDRVDAALTGCAAAIAQTGTLVLDGEGACGRRLITLVPDHHICVVNADQVVDLVPEGLARVAAAVAQRGVPVTLVSGPSASSDIELSRVEGVHGPRNLLVLITE